MNDFMMQANLLAKGNLKSNCGGPFGAVVVKNGKIIGRGCNCVLKNNDPTAHAEIMAIRDACNNINNYDLSGCVIYTSCYPCPMCLSAIVWSNIKTVYYGNSRKDAKDIGFRDDFIYDLINNIDNNNYFDLIEIDRNETIKTFEEYKNKKDRIIY